MTEKKLTVEDLRSGGKSSLYVRLGIGAAVLSVLAAGVGILDLLVRQKRRYIEPLKSPGAHYP